MIPHVEEIKLAEKTIMVLVTLSVSKIRMESFICSSCVLNYLVFSNML